MSLVKCKECGHEISTSAPSCPHCGAKAKHTSGLIKLLGYGIFFAVLAAVLTSQRGKTPQPTFQPAPVPIPLGWAYGQTSDKIGRGTVKTATIRSLNEVEFDFPYRGPQRATLQLRIHPRYGRNVIVFIERGQFLCQIDDCTVSVRFDNGRPQTYAAAEPADHSTTYLFIRNYDRFLANTRKAKKAYIEAQFYQEGLRVFEFNVAGLKW